MTALGTGPLSDSLRLLPHPHCPEVESRQPRAAGCRVLSARRSVGAPHYPPSPGSGRTLGAASAELDEAQRALEFKNPRVVVKPHGAWMEPVHSDPKCLRRSTCALPGG